MDIQPSETTLRLVRARARLDTTYLAVTAAAAMDTMRWSRMAERIGSASFDPALVGTGDLEHAQEAERLAYNLLAALTRLVVHLEGWEGSGAL